jgi:3D (Asp-Asp-Asp) domain-containing protein
MRITARGSVLFGFAAVLLIVSFYLTTTTEAKEAFNIAFDSNSSIQELNQANQSTNELQTENLQQNNQATVNLSAAQNYRATAYCLKGRTAIGGGVRRGIVAADPRVLPLGTRIQISAGSYSGTYTVADTGGAVRGKILDIWVPTCGEAVRFGRKTVSVSVVGGRKSKSNS